MGVPMTLSHTAAQPPPMSLPLAGEQPRTAPVAPALAHARTGMHRHGMIALPAEERWVHTARHFAASLLARWDVVPEDQDSVLLIVGELAGNAAQHGRADMIVSLTFEGRAVRIEVADPGATAPSPHRCTSALEERHRRRDRADVRVATHRPGPSRAGLVLA